MARLLIIGASGGIGFQAVKLALDDGHEVCALSRSASKIALQHPQLEKIDGDATDPEALRPALTGVSAVIHAIGMAPGLKRTFCDVTLFSASTAALVQEMQRAQVARLVAVTGFGAGDSKSAQSWPERLVHRAALGKAYEDKDRQEDLIRSSGLDWLIVRPTILTNGAGRGQYQVLLRPKDWRNGLISRRDVAAFLLQEAIAPSLHRETPTLTY